VQPSIDANTQTVVSPKRLHLSRGEHALRKRYHLQSQNVVQMSENNNFAICLEHPSKQMRSRYTAILDQVHGIQKSLIQPCAKAP